MIERGETVYWVATTIAELIFVLSVVSYFWNVSEGLPVFPLAPLILAAVIWLVGYFCRHALNGRRS